MYTSQVLTMAGDPEAWEAQDRALAAYPADDPMDRPLILLDRARHLAQHGEAEEASRTAAGAITALSADLRVPLLMAQVSGVAAKIETLSPASADELRDRLGSRG